MSVVRFFTKKSRLATLIDEPGGQTVRKTMAEVGRRLEDIRADGMAVVEEAIATLERLAQAQPDEVDPWLDEIYALASNVLEAVGPYGMDDVARAAFSLCDLADRFRYAGKCNIASIRVHVQALRLLSSPEFSGEEGRREVLEGLQRVLARAPKPQP